MKITTFEDRTIKFRDLRQFTTKERVNATFSLLRVIISCDISFVRKFLIKNLTATLELLNSMFERNKSN